MTAARRFAPKVCQSPRGLRRWPWRWMRSWARTGRWGWHRMGNPPKIIQFMAIYGKCSWETNGFDANNHNMAWYGGFLSGGTPSYHPKLAIINGKTLKQMVWGTQISGNLRQGLLDRHLLRSDTGGTCERIWGGKGMSAINSGISWNSSKNIRQTNMWATCGE